MFLKGSFIVYFARRRSFVPWSAKICKRGGHHQNEKQPRVEHRLASHHATRTRWLSTPRIPAHHYCSDRSPLSSAHALRFLVSICVQASCCATARTQPIYSLLITGDQADNGKRLIDLQYSMIGQPKHETSEDTQSVDVFPKHGATGSYICHVLRKASAQR